LGASASPSQKLRRLDADAAMTAERDEVKHLVPASSARGFADAVSARLPRHHYLGDGANQLPGAQHFVSTIYFDTPSRDLYRESQQGGAHLKLRAKEYYDLHPSLVELVTDPSDLVRHTPVLWLELKHRDGARSTKRRVGVPKRDVPAFFAEGRVTKEMIAIQAQTGDAESARTLTEVAELCGRFAEPLRADCLVNYRRVAWQDDSGTLRVTLDLGVAFFAPPADLWTRARALVRPSLGAPGGHESRSIVEIKSRDTLPPWLIDVLAHAGASRVPYSKFESASRVVHG
jgi:hypothetical protein